MKQVHHSRALTAVMIAAFILASTACNAQPALPVDVTAPAAAPTTIQTVTPVSPTAPPMPTEEPPATATAIKDRDPAATATLVPSPTPVPDRVIDPFTGLLISTTVANHIPLLVKVSNSPEVRPQTGLALADVVLEHYSEGGITRFTALFLTNTPEKVGSVRSCRLIDLELPVIFQAGIVCSGTSAGTRLRLLRSKSWEGSGGVISHTVWMVSDLGTFECRAQAGCKLPMFRTPDRLPPHNLYANTVNAWKELAARKKNQPTTFHSWVFSSTIPSIGQPATMVTIPYSSGAVTWAHNASSDQWTRAIAGRPHTDKETGQPISTSNVIIVYANHVATDIIESNGGARSIEIQLWGSGPLKVFRNGEVIEGMWKRDRNASELAFVDMNGDTIALKPGTSWIELVPLTLAVKAS